MNEGTPPYPFTESRLDEHCPNSFSMGSDIPGPFRTPKRRRRPIANNAARERSRVRTLRSAFLDLQRSLPAVPPDTKLSKLDVLVLASTYIAHLMTALQDGGNVSQLFAANGCMHPVKVLAENCPTQIRGRLGVANNARCCINQKIRKRRSIYSIVGDVASLIKYN